MDREIEIKPIEERIARLRLRLFELKRFKALIGE